MYTDFNLIIARIVYIHCLRMNYRNIRLVKTKIECKSKELFTELQSVFPHAVIPLREKIPFQKKQLIHSIVYYESTNFR